MLYTLTLFNLIGFRHNDLHASNTLIQELDWPQTLLYFITDTTYYKIVTRYIPKIFDYDRKLRRGNQKYHIGRHEYCIHYAECGRENPKADLFKFLTSLWRVPQVEHEFIKNFVLWCTDGTDTLFRMQTTAVGSLCKTSLDMIGD